MDTKDYKALDRHVRNLLAAQQGIKPDTGHKGTQSPITTIHDTPVAPGWTDVMVMFFAGEDEAHDPIYQVMNFAYCPTAERSYTSEMPIRRKNYTPTFGEGSDPEVHVFSGAASEADALECFAKKLRFHAQGIRDNILPRGDEADMPHGQA